MNIESITINFGDKEPVEKVEKENLIEEEKPIKISLSREDIWKLLTKWKNDPSQTRH